MSEPTWADKIRARYHPEHQPTADTTSNNGGQVVHLQPINGGAPAGQGGYGTTALERELDALLDLRGTEGSRNAQLNTAAFNLYQLVASGHLPELEVHDRLRDAALQIGLTPSETEATIGSGRRAGLAQPRIVQPLAQTDVQITEVAPHELAGPGAGQQQDAQGGTQGGTQDGEQAGPAPRTSWWPQPIAERAAAAAEEPSPTHLLRDDGQALFYSGKVNGLIGESESGKSWVALLAVVQATGAGQRALILDFEDSPASVHRRLAALGCTLEQLALVDYANPDEALQAIQSRDLGEALTQRYAVIVADGVNAAMTLLGFDLNSNTDATAFATRFLRPLARSGACVITVDHVPKNPEQRGKGGIGAQAKRAMQDGCTILVEVVEPFGKGQSGTLKLTVDKDRNGAVRGISGGGKYAGKAHLDSVDDHVRIHIDGPDLRPVEERGPWRPTGLMEKVSRVLEQTPELSANDVVSAVGSRKDAVLKAVAVLLDEGYAAVEIGPRRARLHTSVRPYRQADDPGSDRSEPTNLAVVPTGSRLVPGTGEVTGSRPISPYGDGNQSTDADEQRVVPAPTETLDLGDGQSACNRCGDPVDDQVLDETAGYCRPCGRLVNG